MAQEKPKIGAGHLEGMVRKGFKELGAILPAFPVQQGVIEEPGVFGNLTPGEIAAGKKEDAQVQTLNEEKIMANEQKSVHGDQGQQAEAPQQYTRSAEQQEAGQRNAAQQAAEAAKTQEPGQGLGR